MSEFYTVTSEIQGEKKTMSVWGVVVDLKRGVPGAYVAGLRSLDQRAKWRPSGTLGQRSYPNPNPLGGSDLA